VRNRVVEEEGKEIDPLRTILRTMQKGWPRAAPFVFARTAGRILLQALRPLLCPLRVAAAGIETALIPVQQEGRTGTPSDRRMT
jgi:hypothetical protein